MERQDTSPNDVPGSVLQMKSRVCSMRASQCQCSVSGGPFTLLIVIKPILQAAELAQELQQLRLDSRAAKQTDLKQTHGMGSASSSSSTVLLDAGRATASNTSRSNSITSSATVDRLSQSSAMNVMRLASSNTGASVLGEATCEAATAKSVNAELEHYKAR